MKITILNGSPKKGNTAAMAEAFCESAMAAGHEVEILHVGKMKINGCLGCEYCHGKGEGKCIQKDDMEKVMPAYLESDMIVYASPIYYFNMTAQLAAAISKGLCHRQACQGEEGSTAFELRFPEHRRRCHRQLQDDGRLHGSGRCRCHHRSGRGKRLRGEAGGDSGVRQGAVN